MRIPLIGLDIRANRSPKIAVDQGSIRNPASTSTGTFGGTITDSDLLFAVQREPIAHRIVFTVAHDIFDKWFTVEDPREEEKDPDLNKKVQAALNELNADNVFTEMAIFERLYGYSIIVVGFDDGAELDQPVTEGRQVETLNIYEKTRINNIFDVTDLEDERYGLPDKYQINQGLGNITTVDHTRVIHVATRLLTHRYKGISVLESVFDDLTCLRNIRWGMTQTMVRVGSGFPDVTLNGASIADLDAFIASGRFDDLNARTSFIHNEQETIEFKGASGVALNPLPYYDPILENISAGSGIPKAILRGAQAGALTGSEVNLQEYFKIISDAQGRYEPAIRLLIDLLIESGQIKTSAEEYVIKWTPGYEPSAIDKASVEESFERAQNMRSQYMKINEVRKKAHLEEIPGEDGEKIMGLLKATQPSNTGFPPNLDEAEKNVGMSHPSLQAGLGAIVERCVSAEISRAQAIEEAKALIVQYVEVEKNRARAYIRARTGITRLEITPEMEHQYEGMLEEYAKNFGDILDDALRQRH